MPLGRETFNGGAVLVGGDVQGEDGVRGREGDEELPASPASPLSDDKAVEVDALLDACVVGVEGAGLRVLELVPA